MSNNNYSLAKVREKFTDWWWSVSKCSVIYGGIYVVSKAIINLFIAKHMEYLTSNYTRPTIFFTGVILGIIYIWDAKISGYLKTPLARLSIKVENCEFWEDEEKDEQEKVFFLSASQENNELFKKTFEKFGIIAIPFLLVNLLDNGRLEIIKKFSNSPWFLSCYILPVLWGTWF